MAVHYRETDLAVFPVGSCSARAGSLSCASLSLQNRLSSVGRPKTTPRAVEGSPHFPPPVVIPVNKLAAALFEGEETCAWGAELRPLGSFFSFAGLFRSPFLFCVLILGFDDEFEAPFLLSWGTAALTGTDAAISAALASRRCRSFISRR